MRTSLFKKFRVKKIFIFLAAALLLRLLLSPFGTYEGDMSSWVGWGNRLQEVGFGRFYEAWSDYLPGYLYILLLWGKLFNFLWQSSLRVSAEIFFKLPAILSDVLTGYLIYRIAKRWVGEENALVSSILYLFNPAVLANSTLWGQVDSVLTLSVLLTIWLFLKEKLILAPFFLAFSCVTKPQGFLLIPLVFLILLKKRSRQDLLIFSTASLLFFLIFFWPFVGEAPLVRFAWERFQATLNQYPYTSLNAFNLWGIGNLVWKKDSLKFLGISYQIWGLVFFGSLYLFALSSFSKRLKKKILSNLPALVIFLAVVSYASFNLLTRVHERHLFPVFAFLALASAFKPKLWVIYFFSSLLYVLNLHFAYVWLTQNFREIFSPFLVSLFAIVNLGLLLHLLKVFVKKNRIAEKKPETRKPSLTIPNLPLRIKTYFLEGSEEGEGKKDLSPRYFLLLLVVVVLFSFVTRFWRLGVPPEHFFDEVYHAFTAQEILKGNSAAWGWWGTPPKGFAYEWTHPPFAKLAMATTLWLFGNSAFGWRIAPALFGIGSVVVIALLGKKLFGPRAGILAAFLATFDGLMFFQSRIGMNDIFFLFFMLASLYFFCRKNWWGAGINFGLALSSKWTAVYLLPFYGLFQLYESLPLFFKDRSRFWKFLRRRIFRSSFFLLVLPLGVYILVYLPFFLSGHSWSQFIELQKQMWWYHTRLRATHPFTSPWWSWPIMKRPVWCFAETNGENVSNIYAMGNPIIWWAGLPALLLLGWQILKKYSRTIAFILLGYLSFWLPWALSPRIMFIYHYLPSLSLLIIALGWLLGKRWKSRKGKVLTITFLLLTALLFFYFYPRLSAWPVSEGFNQQYRWFESW